MESENPLSPEMHERIDALARQVSVAQDLDPAIQAELAGHIQDKVQGYLSGQEKLTEADAFVLAREHFGDPQAVQGLFRKALRRPSVPRLGPIAYDLAEAALALLAAQAIARCVGTFVNTRFVRIPAMLEAIRTNDTSGAAIYHAQFWSSMFWIAALPIVFALLLWCLRRLRVVRGRNVVTLGVFVLGALALQVAAIVGGNYLSNLLSLPGAAALATSNFQITGQPPAWQENVRTIASAVGIATMVGLTLRATAQRGMGYRQLFMSFGVYLLVAILGWLVICAYLFFPNLRFPGITVFDTLREFLSMFRAAFAHWDLPLAFIVLLLAFGIHKYRQRNLAVE